jgi:hypothetical protein
MFDEDINENEDGELQQQQENEDNVVHETSSIERKRKMTEMGNEMKKTKCKLFLLV